LGVCLKSTLDDVIIKQTKTKKMGKVKISRLVPFRTDLGL